MAGTVNLFGSPVKKGYVIAGGAVLVIAVGYGWYKNRQAGSSTTATTAADTSSTGTTDTTGSSDTSGYDGGGYGYGGWWDGSGWNGNGTGGQYSTNGQWAQAAEQYLTGNTGLGSEKIAAALGKYISGQPVTDDQVTIIEQAIAFDGYPPVNGPSGYPPSYRTTTTTGGGDVTVPQTTGKSAGEAHDLIIAAGLVPEAVRSQKPDMVVTGTVPAAGHKVARGSHVWIHARQKGK